MVAWARFDLARASGPGRLRVRPLSIDGYGDRHQAGSFVAVHGIEYAVAQTVDQIVAELDRAEAETEGDMTAMINTLTDAARRSLSEIDDDGSFDPTRPE